MFLLFRFLSPLLYQPPHIHAHTLHEHLQRDTSVVQLMSNSSQEEVPPFWAQVALKDRELVHRPTGGDTLMDTSFSLRGGNVVSVAIDTLQHSRMKSLPLRRGITVSFNSSLPRAKKKGVV